ncbi:MAG: UbiA-like polyprenyltransferase [Planctomycetota bacterium]
MLQKLALILKAIKFEHTVFALPFAVISVFFASDGWPEWRILGWLLAAMISARSAAMGFNRLVDFKYDTANPRTRLWPVSQGQISRLTMGIFTLSMVLLFILSAAQLNPLTFSLSPIALAIIMGYSYSKRFTALTHFWLGACLAMAPVGAWLAIKGQFNIFPLMLGAAVTCWTAGFDIIYATQDMEFDRSRNLHSIPAKFGITPALKISAGLHLLMLLILISLIPLFYLGLPYLIGWCLIAGLIIYEHALVKPDNLQKVNQAFFNVNAVVSLVLMITCLIEVLYGNKNINFTGYF